MTCNPKISILMTFARFHSGRETLPNSNTSFPSFKSRRDWYPIRLFVTPQSNYVRLKYGTLNASVRQALLPCDIHCKASTHTSRKSGAQLAEQGRAPEEEISRHGRLALVILRQMQEERFSFAVRQGWELASTCRILTLSTFWERLGTYLKSFKEEVVYNKASPQFSISATFF